MKLNLISGKLSKTVNSLKKKCGFASLVLGAAMTLLPVTNVKAQMNSLTMPPFRFNATTNPVGTNNVLYPGGSSASGNYFVANGAYDQNGALLFYVQDNWVYSSGGAPVGPLGKVIGTLPVYDLGGEIAIVPVPGECSKYYVIYTRSDISFPINTFGQGTFRMAYVIVDCPNPSTTPTIIYQSGCCPQMAFLPNGILDSHYENSFNSGIAVSRKSGTGASAIYTLYFTTNWGIESFYIDAMGIHYYAAVSPIANAGSSTTELELSADGKWLAVAQMPFGGGNGQVAVVDMTTPLSMYSPSFYGTYSQISGLEFVGTGTPKLYITGKTASSGSAFDMVDFTALAPAFSNLISNIAPYNLDNSFIECSKSGKVCGISDYNGARYFVEYDPASSSVSSAQQIDVSLGVHVNPNGSNITLGGYNPANTYNGGLYPSTLYTLPDQIDGGDYDHFNIDYYINKLSINGLLAQNNCAAGALNIYSCAGVNITATTNDELPSCATQKLEIEPYNLSNCEFISTTGPGFFHYSDIVKGPIKDMELHKLTDSYGNSLENVKGVYKVTVTIRDCCGNVTTMSAIIKMRYAPGIDLDIYQYQFPTYVPANHTTPIPSGAISVGFKVNNSAGDADNMNVQVDQLTGTWGGIMAITNIFSQDVGVSNLSSITNEQLNNYCVPTSSWMFYPGLPTCNVTSPSAYSGNPNFFSANSSIIMGNYYKLTVTLSNECGTSSDYSYLQIDDAAARPTSVLSLSAKQNAAHVYPNPANDKVQIAISSQTSDVYQIALYDISGRLIKTIADKISFDAGDHTLDVNTTDLQTGVYTWKIHSQGINKSGLISIIK